MGSALARVSQAQRTLQLQLRRCIATGGMLSVAGVESQDFLHKEHRKQQAASGHKLANL